MTKASDKIWGLVCGLAGAENRRNRKLMALKAYIDESADGEGKKAFVLSGYISTAERWALLSDAWDELCKRDHQGSEFKMSKSWKNTKKVENFYALIEEYALSGVCFILNIENQTQALSAVKSNPSFDLFENSFKNPYFLGTKMLMQYLAINATMLKLTEPLDFIFDNKVEKVTLLGAWDHFKSSAPDEVSRNLGGSLTFGDSKELMPLQAADLSAGMIQQHETKIGKWTGQIPCNSKGTIKMLQIRPSVETLVKEYEWIMSDENSEAAKISPEDKNVWEYLKRSKKI